MPSFIGVKNTMIALVHMFDLIQKISSIWLAKSNFAL
ncbi:hypothetical protein NYA8BAC_02635 [Psychrobacter okhotskensis]